MEKPNINYINEIADNDTVFKTKLITILKEELPLEIAEYENKMKISDYFGASNLVRKIKHKISVMGMNKSYNIADKFEYNLKNQSEELKSDFNKILFILQNYTASL